MSVDRKAEIIEKLRQQALSMLPPEPPRWTTEPPTVPGWYWERGGTLPDTIIRVQEMYDGVVWYWSAGSDQHSKPSDYVHSRRQWLRIEPPAAVRLSAA